MLLFLPLRPPFPLGKDGAYDVSQSHSLSAAVAHSVQTVCSLQVFESLGEFGTAGRARCLGSGECSVSASLLLARCESKRLGTKGFLGCLMVCYGTFPKGSNKLLEFLLGS